MGLFCSTTDDSILSALGVGALGFSGSVYCPVSITLMCCLVLAVQLQQEVGDMLQRAVDSYDTQMASRDFLDTIQSAVSFTCQ